MEIEINDTAAGFNRSVSPVVGRHQFPCPPLEVLIRGRMDGGWGGCSRTKSSGWEKKGNGEGGGGIDSSAARVATRHLTSLSVSPRCLKRIPLSCFTPRRRSARLYLSSITVTGQEAARWENAGSARYASSQTQQTREATPSSRLTVAVWFLTPSPLLMDSSWGFFRIIASKSESFIHAQRPGGLYSDRYTRSTLKCFQSNVSVRRCVWCISRTCHVSMTFHPLSIPRRDPTSPLLSQFSSAEVYGPATELGVRWYLFRIRFLLSVASVGKGGQTVVAHLLLFLWQREDVPPLYLNEANQLKHPTAGVCLSTTCRCICVSLFDPQTPSCLSEHFITDGFTPVFQCCETRFDHHIFLAGLIA